jgi:hypothetical protein
MLLRPPYLSQKLDRPLPTKDGGTLRTIGEACDYMEIDRELERDRARNTAELLAEFRSDLWAAKRDEVETQCDELVRKLRERYPVLVAELIRPRARRAVGDLP